MFEKFSERRKQSRLDRHMGLAVKNTVERAETVLETKPTVMRLNLGEAPAELPDEDTYRETVVPLVLGQLGLEGNARFDQTESRQATDEFNRVHGTIDRPQILAIIDLSA